MKYKWWMEQYVRLMSQYTSGIFGMTKQSDYKTDEEKAQGKTQQRRRRR